MAKEEETQKDLPLQNKIFVLTGSLPSLTRSKAQELIENAGGKVSNSINKKTSYLLAGENAGSKLQKADVLGVEVIDEQKLRDFLKN